MKIDYKLIVAIIALFVSIYLFSVRDILGITYNRNIRRADNFFKLEEFEEAKKSYINALEVKPNDTYCLNRIEACKIELNKLANEKELGSKYNKEEKQKQKQPVQKKFNPYKITPNSIGGIKPGMKVYEIEDIYKGLKEFDVKIIQSCEGGCDIPDYFILKDKNTGDFLLTCEFGFLDDPSAIHAIYAWSNKYRTYNGIHPGMNISKYLSLYPEASLYNYPKDRGTSYIESEYFFPNDLQSKDVALNCAIMPTEIDIKKLLNGELVLDQEIQKLSLEPNDTQSRKYNKNGYISRVILEMKGFESISYY